MFKKNIYLAIGLMASLAIANDCHGFFSYFKSTMPRLTEKEEMDYEALLTLYALNNLNQFHFMDSATNSIDLINDAIKLVEKHNHIIYLTKNNAYGYLYNSKKSGLAKIIGISLQILSLIVLASTPKYAYPWYLHQFNSSKSLEELACPLERVTYHTDEHLQIVTEHIEKTVQHKAADFFLAMTVLGAMIGTISYMFCRKATNNFIQDAQKQCALNMIILARLKEIKYNWKATDPMMRRFAEA